MDFGGGGYGSGLVTIGRSGGGRHNAGLPDFFACQMTEKPWGVHGRGVVGGPSGWGLQGGYTVVWKACFVWKQCRYSATSSSPFFALTQRRSEKGCLYSSLIKVIGYFRSVSRGNAFENFHQPSFPRVSLTVLELSRNCPVTSARVIDSKHKISVDSPIKFSHVRLLNAPLFQTIPFIRSINTSETLETCRVLLEFDRSQPCRLSNTCHSHS